MAFLNRFRLPFKLTRPQLLEERQTFRKSNGQIVVLSSVIRKQYEGETDNWPEKLHDRFKIALSHDNVTIEGERYAGSVVQDGDYTISWSDFLDYPLAKAAFKVLATPFDATNTNCGVCQDYIQIVAVDDTLPDLSQGQTISVAVLNNDSICCDPVELTLITTNSDYVDTIEVQGTQLNIAIKNPVATQNNVLLATYRVQCENGQYDEANVYANITGSAPAVCLAPSVFILSVEAETASFRINPPATLPADGYEWEVRQGLTIIASGTIPVPSVFFDVVDLTGLTPSTEYTAYARSVCGAGDYSNYDQVTFTTNPPDDTGTCGRYRLAMDDGSGDPSHFRNVQYYDCNGDLANTIVPNTNSTFICALQTTPGDPVYIQAGGGVDISYTGLCDFG